MFLVLQAIKTYIGYKLVYAAVLSIKNLKSKVATLYQLLSRAQKVNIQNQQSTLPTVNRVKYNKAAWYLAIKFLSRIEYNHAKLTVQTLKISIKGSFSNSNHIHRKLRIYLHLLKKHLLESFIFFAKTFLFTLHLSQSI